MNRYGIMWGLSNTQFSDPSGLGVFNVSTAVDVSELVQTASGYWLIREISGKKHITVETKNKKKTIHLDHTSGPLLLAFDNVLVSKTGLTNAAGWCVGLYAEHKRQEYVLVVLGSQNKKTRLDTIKNIQRHYIVE